MAANHVSRSIFNQTHARHRPIPQTYFGSLPRIASATSAVLYTRTRRPYRRHREQCSEDARGRGDERENKKTHGIDYITYRYKIKTIFMYRALKRTSVIIMLITVLLFCSHSKINFPVDQ